MVVKNPKVSAEPRTVTFREAFWVWTKIALLSFGGPAGQIAVMHRILVEQKRWISENRFLHALNFCMLLPGPEAQQLAIYIGWMLHRFLGGLVAGILFVIPGFVSILALSFIYVTYQDVDIVEGLFFGLQAAVVAVVVEAVIRIGRRALKNYVMASIAVLSFIAIFFFAIPFPLIVLTAGVIGYAGGKIWEEWFYVIKPSAIPVAGEKPNEGPIFRDEIVAQSRPPVSHTLRTASIFLTLWLGPLAILVAILGAGHIFVTQGVFFSQTATVTFGGAYAVLAYITQRAVETYGWLQPGEMLDGLGMAETTPGPLIQVVQFVGFMGAYRNPGTLDPLVAGIIGSIVVTWVTFIPCFLWIFVGAPYIEYLRGNKSLSTALSGITAAVVGVVLNLAVWFFLHTAFEILNERHAFGMRLLVPEWGTVDAASIIIAAVAFVAMIRFKVDMLAALAAAAGSGLVYHLMFGT